jgi:hypothetical protein
MMNNSSKARDRARKYSKDFAIFTYFLYYYYYYCRKYSCRSYTTTTVQSVLTSRRIWSRVVPGTRNTSSVAARRAATTDLMDPGPKVLDFEQFFQLWLYLLSSLSSITSPSSLLLALAFESPAVGRDSSLLEIPAHTRPICLLLLTRQSQEAG